MKVLVGLLSLLLFAGAVLAPRDLADSLQLPAVLAAMLPQRTPAPTATPTPTPLTGVYGAPTPAPTVASPPKPATRTPAPTPKPTPAPTPATYTVSGRVTATEGGAAVANVTVSFFDSASLALVAKTTTAGDGRYAVQLRSGSYKLRFSPPAPYKDEWFNNKRTSNSANVLTVSTSNKTGVNAKLEQ